MDNREEKPDTAGKTPEKPDEELGGCLAYFVMPVVFFADGVCFSSLWGWFLVPFGLPKIGVAHAFGLILTKKLLFGLNGDATPLKKGQLIRILLLKITTLVIGLRHSQAHALTAGSCTIPVNPTHSGERK